MKNFLNDIRRPINIPHSKQLLYTILIFILGIILGLISKALDETPSNLFPYFLEMLDLGNFFSRMGIWIFFAMLISVSSKTPIGAAINVLMFFVGMVGSYYFYTITVAGFYPKSYMMIWIVMTFISPFLAFICWYAKGKGIIATTISSIIFMLISRQTFGFGIWYFYIKYYLELLLWIATIFVLCQSPKQIVKVVLIGLILFFITAEINLFWGML